jgi:hypothetical protein
VNLLVFYIRFLFCNFSGKTPLTDVFVPTCNGRTSTGISCGDLKSPCKLQKPCKNNGNCTDNKTMLTVYFCSCSPDFDGNRCQNNLQPCEPNPCWNNGKFFHCLRNLIKVF